MPGRCEFVESPEVGRSESPEEMLHDDKVWRDFQTFRLSDFPTL